MRILQILGGLGLLSIGLLLLAFTSGIVSMTLYHLVGIALILSGLFFWIPGFVWRKPLPWLTSLFIPGTLAFAIGGILIYTGNVGIQAWSWLWTLLIIAIGLAVLAMYIWGPRTVWLQWVGVIVAGIGFALLAILLTISAEPTARIVGPVILIALGLLITVRAVVTRRT
ncbi:MAG: hypothetical protein HZB51_29650 [Chloroflexi bacterium]|nr:hypothetical protein [Chloroflexota bacterium]